MEEEKLTYRHLFELMETARIKFAFETRQALSMLANELSGQLSDDFLSFVRKINHRAMEREKAIIDLEAKLDAQNENP